MTFHDFAASYGLRLTSVIEDNRWHRASTEAKPRKKNAAYIFDGSRGAVIDFATMTKAAVFRDGSRAGFIDRAAMKARAALDKAAERAKHTEARLKATQMLQAASVDVHPYLAAKGFPKERGFVLNGELLVPMREFADGTLNSLQRISADGTKLFLPGGKAKSSVYVIGPPKPRGRWLVEGYATALSLLTALGAMYSVAQTIVCFSAGNLAHIGRVVKARRERAFVFADNDASGAGQKAAEETGLPWVMAPEVGMDANDVHQRDGVWALVRLIRRVEGLSAKTG